MWPQFDTNTKILFKYPIMSDEVHKCQVCGRDNFKTKRGLTQHMLSRKACNPVVSSRELFGLSAGDMEGRKKRLRGMIEFTAILRPSNGDNLGVNLHDDGKVGANFCNDDEIVCGFSEEESEGGDDLAERSEATDSDDEELYEKSIIDSESEEDDDNSSAQIDVEMDDNNGVPIDDLLQKISRNMKQGALILRGLRRNITLPWNFVVFCDKPRHLWQHMRR